MDTILHYSDQWLLMLFFNHQAGADGRFVRNTWPRADDGICTRTRPRTRISISSWTTSSRIKTSSIPWLMPSPQHLTRSSVKLTQVPAAAGIISCPSLTSSITRFSLCWTTITLTTFIFHFHHIFGFFQDQISYAVISASRSLDSESLEVKMHHWWRLNLRLKLASHQVFSATLHYI